MNVRRFTHLISLVLICLVALMFTSLPAQGLAQGVLGKAKEGVQKGAEGVKKGAETAGEKTKEGAEAVGHGVKKAVTGEDREKGTEYQTQQPVTRPSGTMTAESGKHHKMAAAKAGGKRLPRTAGEIPLFALSGTRALAGAALSRMVRRKKSD